MGQGYGLGPISSIAMRTAARGDRVTARLSPKCLIGKMAISATGTKDYVTPDLLTLITPAYTISL
jgi:hypothetical protein